MKDDMLIENKTIQSVIQVTEPEITDNQGLHTIKARVEGARDTKNVRVMAFAYQFLPYSQDFIMDLMDESGKEAQG